MLTIWGRLNSINVQKATWAVEEAGLAYKRIDAGGPFGLNDTPEYLAMNPTGLVPTLQDESGFTLWESNTIVRYIAAQHAVGTLWPEDPAVRAKSDTWMDWQTTAFTPAMRDVFWHSVRMPPETRNAEVMAASLAQGERMAAILDRHLADRPYVAGDSFTMGDIPVGAVVHRWLRLPVARESRPNLERYDALLKTRPAAGRVLPVTLS